MPLTTATKTEARATVGGHSLPCDLSRGAAAVPPNTDATVARRRVRYGPILLRKSSFKGVLAAPNFLSP
jgi:hypothetical protein